MAWLAGLLMIVALVASVIAGWNGDQVWSTKFLVYAVLFAVFMQTSERSS